MHSRPGKGQSMESMCAREVWENVCADPGGKVGRECVPSVYVCEGPARETKKSIPCKLCSQHRDVNCAKINL